MSRELTVLSFNILRDRRDETDWAWPRRCGLVVEVIERLQPDVIAFQEVAPDMRADLAQRLPAHKWVPRPHDEAHGRALYVGDVAYRDQALALEAHELVICEPEAAGDDGWPLDRWPAIYGGTWARLRFCNGSGPAVVLWSVHLPHQSAPLRCHYAEGMLDAWTKARAEGAVMIAAGDFNDRRGEALHRRLTDGTGLVDARVNEAERAVDWILVGGEAEPMERTVVALERNGIRASDHPALCARLKLGHP